MCAALLLVLATLVALVAWTVWFKRRTRAPWEGSPPGPRALPVIGHLHLLMKPGAAPHTLLQSLARRYGPVMSLQFGMVPLVVASSAAAAKEFLKTHDAVFASRPALSSGKILAYDSDLIFAKYGEHWRQLRRLATLELLTVRRVDAFRSARVDDIRDLCESLLESAGRLVDLRQKLKALTFNIITFMLMHKRYFGKKVEDREEALRFLNVIDDMFDICGEFPISDYFPYLRLIDPVQYRLKALSRSVDVFLDRNIAEHEQNKPSSSEEMDFLDILLDLRNKGEEHLQNNKLKGLMVDLVCAGTDTSSVTLEWALAEMIKHPEVMSKAGEELDKVIGSNRMVNESDLPDLHYLHAVVKETFRLHPAGPLLVPHSSMQASTVMGYHVPCNSTLLVNAYAIGRDESVWEKATEFKPERFVGSKLDVRGHDFEFVPFGAGRRVCPGINLALITVHLTLANLVHGFEWEASGVDTVSEHYGLSVLMAKKLEAVPRPRLPPHAYSSWESSVINLNHANLTSVTLA